ncbi:hypothetical protein [Arthrobacter sp. 2MCAF14]|uniref:hypothetical protein n=1 Tax=Arthrobacter sp. 2MCAF14 TaxID=3232982 RepID=UPI003F8E778A
MQPVVLSVTATGPDGHKFAHYRTSEPPELWIGPAFAKAGAAKQLAVLLHEAAHSVATTRGISDTSDRGRHHNSSFHRIAGEHGLYLDADRKAAHGAATLAPATHKNWGSIIKALEAASPALG